MLYGQPLFSPNGEWVAFTRRVEDGHVSLWIVRADGTDERLLASHPSISGLDWDPTSRMIAYQQWTDEAQHLWIVSIDDGTTHEIESFAGMEYPRLLDWSPGGQWIAASDFVGWSGLWVNRDFLGDTDR